MVIGGSGNGEQIAANKVPGIRCALAWSEETASLAREHNDAQVVSVGGRMHPIEDMTRFVEVFLTTSFSGDERHVRRIGQIGGYERTRELPPLPESAQETTSRMPEGHTLHRLATALDDAFAGHPVRVSSPQGRFAESAALLDGRTVETAESWGKHLWVHFAHDDLVHVHLGLYGRFDVLRDAEAVPAAGRAGAAAAGPGGRADGRAPRRRTPTCAAPPPASSRRREQRAGAGRPARPRPAAARTPTRTWPGTASGAAGRRSPDCSWTSRWSPGSGTSTAPSCSSGTASTRSGRAPACGVGRWRAMWDDLVALMADGVRTGRIDTVRPEHLTDEERAATEPRRGHSYVYRRAGEPCRVCGTAGAHPGPASPQPLLVCEVPAPIPLAGRTVRATTSQTLTIGRRVMTADVQMSRARSGDVAPPRHTVRRFARRGAYADTKVLVAPGRCSASGSWSAVVLAPTDVPFTSLMVPLLLGSLLLNPRHLPWFVIYVFVLLMICLAEQANPSGAPTPRSGSRC